MIENIKKNRSIRRSLGKKLLLTHGFTSGKYMFVKHVGTQLHGIELQVSQYGEGYTMNVGFHYEFLPDLADMDFLPATDFGAGSFLLWSRTHVLRGRGDIWSNYEIAPDQFRRDLEVNVAESLDVLAEWSVKLADPFWFLDNIPPHMLLEKAPFPWRSAVGSGTILRPAVWGVLPHWAPQEFNLCYLLCVLAIRRGNLNLASEYVELGVECRTGKYSQDKLRELLQPAAEGGAVR